MNNPGRLKLEQHAELANSFRKVMRRFASTVTIIATQDEDQLYGMIATAVISVSTSPPAILACINQSASLHQPCIKSGHFTVNLLTVRQADLVGAFSGELKGHARFQYGRWLYDHGLPYLDGAQATLFCTIENRIPYGSHDIIIARVDHALAVDAISPLIWQNGQPAISAPFNI